MAISRHVRASTRPQRDAKQRLSQPCHVEAAPEPPARDELAPEPPARDALTPEPPARDELAPPEQLASGIAGGQSGTLTWRQLRAAGVGPSVIKRRARNGHLHRIHHGVYIVGHTALAPDARERAALLACGDGALISHWSAAHLWGLVEHAPAEVHVTLVGRHCRPKQGIRLHRVTTITAWDRRRKDGIPLVAPARALLEIAADARHDELEQAVAEARVQRLLGDDELDEAIARAGRRAGVGKLRAFLQREQGPALTRSGAERRMRRLSQAAGLPAPIANARVAGYEVDFLWPAQRLVVEVDGYAYHGHRTAFERDRKKGLSLAAAGYRVIRISANQLVYEPLFVAAKLAQALAHGG